MADTSAYQSIRQVLHLLRGAWQRRWGGLLVACVVGALGATGIALMKDRYEASARIYVNTQSVLKPLMAGLAFQPDIDQQVKMLARTLISRPNVERLMKDPTLDLMPQDPVRKERMVSQLMEKIKVAPSGAGNLYAISYRDDDPQRARRLVERLVELFMESTVGSKTRDSQEASRFIDAQIRAYEAKLQQSENRLKDFKVRNLGVTGASNTDYFSRISALSDEVGRLQVELSAAEQSRDALRRELSGEEPQLPVETLTAGLPPPPSEIDVRLESQRRQLDELLRRYTEAHPDVISLRRSIALTEEQKVQQAATRNAKAPGAATSPVFQRIRVALAEAEANVASLRTRLHAQQARLAEARALGSRVPEVEAELAHLNRDYDVIRKNYEQLVARREAASLGVKIDESSQLADFRVVEPARVPSTPVFPGRKILALGAAVAAVAAGALAAFGLSLLHPAFSSERSLQEVSGRPVLGSISTVLNPAMRLQARRQHLLFAGAVLLFLAGHAAWLSWLAHHTRL